ncbi:hypothetical protein Tco_1287243, partial [Tanacetum coccineum]
MRTQIGQHEHDSIATPTRGWYLARRCTVHVCNSRDISVDYESLPRHVGVVGFGTVMLA